MRRFLYWYVPAGTALIAAAVFAHGFYSFAVGDTGEPVNITSTRAPSPVVSGTVRPLILGDSLARGAGDTTYLGIGGRLVDELKRRHIPAQNAVNIAVNGARTTDLLNQLQGHNVRVLVEQSNAIIVSIGGNDLWGDNWRAASPRNPEVVFTATLDRVAQVVRSIRQANPQARIFLIGLYNPFGSAPMGRLLTPFVREWNAQETERFAGDPNLVVVQTADLFVWRDRLSIDRFHPNDEAYTLIARRIADAF